jgi:PIN domain nuclease of toxin-antitoxin system
MTLLDTHVMLWMDTDDARLGQAARRLIGDAWSRGEVAVSAISFWECALLSFAGRVQLPHSPTEWRAQLLDAGLGEAPIDGATGIQAVGLHDLHKDPADRLIIATAIRHAALLLTADDRLLDWPGDVARHDART